MFLCLTYCKQYLRIQIIIPSILNFATIFFLVSSVVLNGQKSRTWFLGSNLQWGISEYPKMQLKRDLIFGFTDLLGGL